MKVHWSVIVLVSVVVLSVGAGVVLDKVAPTALVTVAAAVMAWLIPSPLPGKKEPPQ